MSNKDGVQVEAVNHPDHYRPGTYEAINVIEAWELNFSLGNALKYISRAGLKNENGMSCVDKEIQDLKKAAWYIEREIQRLEKLKCTCGDE